MSDRAQAAAQRLARNWMVSSDSHIIEPPDLWQSRLPAAMRERGPVVREEANGHWWYVDGYKTMSFLGIQAGDRFVKHADQLRISGHFSEVAPASYDPARYIEESASDGIWGSVLYPSQGLVLYAVPVSDVLTAATHAYNDWLAEFCRHDPRRLKGVAILNADDPAEAVQELTRAHRLGLVGAMIPLSPPLWRPYRSPEFDPLWAAAQDLGMPISLHTGADRADPRQGAAAFRLNIAEVPPSVFINKDHQVRQALGDLIFSGVFERFPKLMVGTVEHELSWIPFFLDQLDYTYTDRPRRGAWHKFADPGVLPSDFFRRNVFCSFQQDAVGVRLRDVIGLHTLMFGSDYPHTESTYPRTIPILADILADVPEDEAHAIVCGNAARLYGFDPPPARTARQEAA